MSPCTTTRVISLVLIILGMTAAISAQSRSIDPTLLAKAKTGDAEAEQRLSVSYSYLGNQKEACRWGLMAAQNGNAKAQLIRGEMYKSGSTVCGLPKDDVQAAIWFRKVAGLRQGEIAKTPVRFRKVLGGTIADAQVALGYAYAYGNGVVQNYMQAAYWYRKAADFGNALAQFELGDLYYYGGVFKIVDDSGGSKRLIRDDGGGDFPVDYSLAAIWYRKAAEQGEENSQNNLGGLYEYGQGVPQDYAEAYFWFSLASARQPHYSENRDNVASQLTKTILLQTQERARKWLENHFRQANSQ